MAASTTDSTAPSSQGVLFPESTPGVRSTTVAAKAVLAVAAAASPPLAAAIEQESDWRGRYAIHFAGLETLYTEQHDVSPHSARDALAALHSAYEFDRQTERYPLQAVPTLPPEQEFGTFQVRGAAPFKPGVLEVPYQGKMLAGDQLRRQLDDWAVRGITEPSFGQALQTLMDQPDWLDLREQRFVLLGAGAEIGPLAFLLAHGATVVGVDLDRPPIWERLLATARNSCGTLIAPDRRGHAVDEPDAAMLGANLLTEIPEILAWLTALDGPLTVGAYAYLDGADHVRVVLAMDVIMATLAVERPGTVLAYLATPTDAFAVPAPTAEAAMAAYAARSNVARLQAPLRWASRDRLFVPNVTALTPSDNGREYGVIDGLVVEQGPNYALAKRIQKWRALAARDQGVRISANVAPSTRTASVTRNRMFAAAYAGADRFGGEIFEPATCNALMAAKLIYDLHSPDAAANPAVALAHPLELFMEGANHGGIWRNAYQARSILPVAALFGWRGVRGNG